MKKGEGLYPASLGICEHCKALLTMEDVPENIKDAGWQCSRCGGFLSGKSFGYEEADGRWQKTRWVDIDGKWIETKPAKNFNLRNWGLNARPTYDY